MRKVKYLLSNINLMNIMLSVLLIFLMNYMALPFLKMDAKFTLPAVKKPAVEKADKDEKAEGKSPSLSEYVVIAEHNLFHPERIIPVPKVEVVVPPLPKPEFVLYGTLVTDRLQVAYMEDKKTKEPQDKGSKRQTALRLGDSMSGFVLKEVDRDQVVMQRGEEKIVVSLNEAKVRETPTPIAAAAPAAPASAAAPQKQAAGSRPAQPAQRTAVRGQQDRSERARAVREAARSDPGRMTFGRGGRRSRTSGNGSE